jgi:hypothetical protein
MHRLRDAEVVSEHHRRPHDGREDSPHSSERRSGRALSQIRLRVVRVPGGFAYVEDKPAAERS